MSELSQAERTAMEVASRDWTPTILQRDAISGFEAGWVAGRDYAIEQPSAYAAGQKMEWEAMRERERTLGGALADLLVALETHIVVNSATATKVVVNWSADDYRDMCLAAGRARTAVAASPGESEKVNVPGRRVIEPDGREGSTVIDLRVQPDHGPGEPRTQDELEAQIVRVIAGCGANAIAGERHSTKAANAFKIARALIDAFPALWLTEAGESNG